MRPKTLAEILFALKSVKDGLSELQDDLYVICEDKKADYLHAIITFLEQMVE